MTVSLSDSRYTELLLEFPPQSIRSEEELKQAQNAVNSNQLGSSGSTSDVAINQHIGHC